jgi:hypothetical protein
MAPSTWSKIDRAAGTTGRPSSPGSIRLVVGADVTAVDPVAGAGEPDGHQYRKNKEESHDYFPFD